MPRAKGSKDLKKRKVRKDKGKRKKKFRQTVKFKKRQGNKTELKLMMWIKTKMSKEGYKRWRRDLRPKLTKQVYRPLMRVDVNVQDIDNEEKLKQFMIDNFYPGYFLVKGVSGSLKSSWGTKWVTIVELEVIEKGNGDLVCFIRKDRRLKKYWWWKGE